MDFLKNKPSMVIEAKKAKFSPNIVLQFVLFLAVLLVTTIASYVVIGLISAPYTLKEMAKAGVDATNQKELIEFSTTLASSNFIILLSLFGTVLTTVLVIIYCKFIEKRSLYSMGFVKKKILVDYLIGLVIGFVMFSAAVLICYAKGTLTYEGVTLKGSVGLIVVFFFAFVIQGMSEEVLCRGYFMNTVASKKPLILAILANSVIFSALHLLNANVSVIAIVNIILVGIFFSVFMLKSDSIWGVCAVHTMWNFTQGNFYGINVSGMQAGPSVLKFKPTVDGVLFNGGEFGLESGFATTAVIIIAIVITLLWKGKASEKAVPEEEVPVAEIAG